MLLRKSSADDADFAFETIRRTMRDYAIQTWGNWLEDESRQEAIDEARDGLIDIIELDGKPVGTLQVERRPDAHIIHKLYILPEHQNRGIGTSLIQDLMAEARRDHKPLKLWVLRVNPAQQLYKRLGFEIEEDGEERIFMAYAANAPVSQNRGS